MFCTQCGIELSDQANYCSACGKATGNAPRPSSQSYSQGPERPFSRPREDQKIAGVCAGWARHFGVDVTMVRIIWLLLAIWPPGVGILAYIVCWIAMPRDPGPISATTERAHSA